MRGQYVRPARDRIRSTHLVHGLPRPSGQGPSQDTAMIMPASEVAWRVSTTVGPGGEQRERHAFKDLTGPTAEALCQHTAFTPQLKPDNANDPLCTLCWLFFGTDLADQYGIQTTWGR